MSKLYSESCERNKTFILEKIKTVFEDSSSVLEIGSGTGQHAVFFAENLLYLNWQTSDLLQSHESIKAYIKDSNLKNIFNPLLIDVSKDDWHNLKFDSAFSANTLHIISCENVQNIFKGLTKVISKYFCVYGPFNYNGQYTSKSNEQFDEYLKQAYPNQAGIKDISFIENTAKNYSFDLINDFDMPSNNRLLVLKKT